MEGKEKAKTGAVYPEPVMDDDVPVVPKHWAEMMMMHHSKDILSVVRGFIIAFALMARRLIDNITIDRLAEEFDLSVSQVKRIIWKDSEIIFRHLEKD